MRTSRRVWLIAALYGATALSCSFRGPVSEPLVDAASGPVDTATLTHHEQGARSIAEFLRARRTGLRADQIERVALQIAVDADRHELLPELVVAVIDVESSGYNWARSRVGALGLMQLKPTTAEPLARKLGISWHGPGTLFDPVVNVQLGTAYLAHLMDRFGNLEIAIAAYNEGPTRIARLLARGRRLPRAYTQRVLHSYDAQPLRPSRREA